LPFLLGGLAGAASKITSAMAKGVAAMTLDEDYQQKRREAMNKQPAGLREGITRGGKGLVSGFVSGITGIVTKPIKGKYIPLGDLYYQVFHKLILFSFLIHLPKPLSFFLSRSSKRRSSWFL